MTQEDASRNVLIDRLLDLAAHTAIVHHIPGRVRLKVKLSGLTLAMSLDIDDVIKCFDGVLDVRTNAAARSIVINYDTRVISPDLWENLVNGNKDPSIKTSVQKQLEELSRSPESG